MATSNYPNTDENVGECRVLIVGHSGSGKSTLANRLLGLPGISTEDWANSVHEDLAERGFVVSSGLDSGTKLCQYQRKRRLIGGREFSLMVADTPGLFDPGEKDLRLTLTEITRSMALCCPGGPHVVMFVVPYGRFTEEKEKSFDAIMTLFSDTVKSHMMIVFTHGEELQGRSIKEVLVRCQAKGVKKVLATIPDNLVVCSNLPDRQDAEMEDILEMVSDVSHNCTTCYSNELLMKMTREIEKEINRLRAEKGLSYAQAIEEANASIIRADDRNAFWTGLLIIVAMSGLFALFVATFWGVGIGVACGIIAAALKPALVGGKHLFLTSFSTNMNQGFEAHENSSHCTIL